MIAVKREPEPKSLVDNADVWKNEYVLARKNAQSNPSKENKAKRKKAESKYAQSDVKTTLKKMFNGKCAYCESHITPIAFPHIEHFKPKDTYPEDCFKWENLLLGCAICNSAEYKSTKFPLDKHGKPLFVNPCDEDPDLHFDFLIVPDSLHPLKHIAVVKPKSDKGTVTEKEIGLNRADLLNVRTQYLLPYFHYIAILAGSGDEEAKSLLKSACSPDFSFSGFTKTLYKRYVGNI